MKKWIINIFGFVIGYLLSFIIIQTVYPSPLTDEIQRLYDEGKIDEVTAKILEHELLQPTLLEFLESLEKKGS